MCVCVFFLQWTALHSAYMLGKTKSIEYWIDFFQRTAHRTKTSIHWNSNVDLDIFFFEFYVNLIGSVQIRRFLLMKMEFSLVQFEMHVNTHTHTQWERFKWINIEHSEYEEKKRNTNNSHVLFRAYLYTFCNNQFAIWHFQIQKAFHGLLIFVDDCITNAWHLPIKERQMKHGAY